MRSCTEYEIQSNVAFNPAVTSACTSWSLRSSIVHLEVDNRQCFLQSTECFQSTNDAAAFLGALASSGKLDVPYTIQAVYSE